MYINRNWSIKFRELLYRFKQLTPQRKLTIGIILFSGIILIIGTIVIISSTVFRIDEENKKEKIQGIRNSLETISTELDQNLTQYGFEKIDEEINVLDNDFKTYEEEVMLFDSVLTGFDLPLSSPINEN